MNPLLIGELYHCTRAVRLGGPSCQRGADGLVRYSFKNLAGDARSFVVPAGRVSDRVQAVAVALDLLATGDAVARECLQTLILRQERAGAAFIDFNVDQYSNDPALNAKAWDLGLNLLLETTNLPPSIDSSSETLLKRGLDICKRKGRTPLINSITSDFADWSWAGQGPMVLSASGGAVVSPSGKERAELAIAMVQRARALGIPDHNMYVDPLVLPLSTDPGQGQEFLLAVRTLRETCGPKIHITAGVGNCSFGLPQREVFNRTFLRLAMQAGLDAPIADPAVIASAEKDPPVLVSAAERLIAGQDPDGMEYLDAARTQKS